jgi:hypothetical protein
LSTGFDGRRILSGVGRWDTIFDRGGVGWLKSQLVCSCIVPV